MPYKPIHLSPGELRGFRPHAGVRVVVLIPVLDRPQRVKPLVDSLTEAARYTTCDPLFLVSPQDVTQRQAVEDIHAWREVVTWEPGPGDYARKMNHGIVLADLEGYDFAFLAADDLVFHPGWIERAIARQLETNACVIGTNDLGNSRTVTGRHSTHTLVHRGYFEAGTIDDPAKLLHEGYDHNYVDDEFVQTAIYRGLFVHATDAIVEHLHPDWGKGPVDGTYTKGKAHFADDRLRYIQRSRHWGVAPQPVRKGRQR